MNICKKYIYMWIMWKYVSNVKVCERIRMYVTTPIMWIYVKVCDSMWKYVKVFEFLWKILKYVKSLKVW